MGERRAAVRKTAADTVREAEEHVLRSEEIVSQSILIVERAERLLIEMGRLRDERRAQIDGDSGESSQRS